jgi:hypothetical protein
MAECLQQDLRNHNTQKRKQSEARLHARRSLKNVGLMSANNGRQMTHILRDKAAKKAANRSEAARKVAITHAKNAATKQLIVQLDQPSFILYRPPTTP